MGLFIEARERVAYDRVPEIKETETQFRRYAGATWNGIEEASRTKTGFIDDQIIPTNGEYLLSGETSITNMGLVLPCTIAASELGLLKESASESLDKSISEIEHLPRTKKRFLYTWYDTENGQGLNNSKKSGDPWPLVSTVDTAWLLAGLMTARQAYPEFKERVDKIMRSVNVTFLYDKKKGLFWGVYDGVRNKPTGFHYDLLASEARMMTYIAMQEYGIPTEAYFKLGREGVGKSRSESGGKQKLMSSGGGALEILSPRLLVPEGEWSELGLNILQKRFVDCMVRGNPKMGSGGYKSPCEEGGVYGEHGIGEFSLNNPCTGETETPVAAFLGLSIQPEKIPKFLSRIEWEIPGVYREDLGFAASFNRKNRTASKAKLAVDSEMIFLAIANHVLDGKIQKLFAPQVEATVKPLLASENYCE